MSLALQRFFKYSAVGFSTFLFDLALLYILTSVLSVHFVIAAGVAFIIAVSINYFLSRKFVFVGTLRSIESGYVNFLLIMIIGLVVVTGGMYVLVTFWGFSYLLSRVVVAGFTGFWNYLMNLYVNFRVAGKH